jgi:hypothetical protein
MEKREAIVVVVVVVVVARINCRGRGTNLTRLVAGIDS